MRKFNFHKCLKIWNRFAHWKIRKFCKTSLKITKQKYVSKLLVFFLKLADWPPKIIDSLSTKRSATWTQTLRNQIVKANQIGRICHTPVSHWLIYLGYVGFQFPLQLTFCAETLQWVSTEWECKYICHNCSKLETQHYTYEQHKHATFCLHRWYVCHTHCDDRIKWMNVLWKGFEVTSSA